jgi:prepilin-type N-terminal cleavage/methylation domain-containing protein
MMKTKGLTLIEIMMAMTILVILLTLSVMVFSRFVTNERREIAERSLQEDIRFALELFMREARTGYASTYLPVNDGHGIVFNNQNGTCVKYYLTGTSLSHATTAGAGCDDTTPFGPPDSITGNTTEITRLDFKMPADVSTTPNELNRQGFVTVVIEARSKNSNIPTLQLQTTVTSRQAKAYGT